MEIVFSKLEFRSIFWEIKFQVNLSLIINAHEVNTRIVFFFSLNIKVLPLRRINCDA